MICENFLKTESKTEYRLENFESNFESDTKNFQVMSTQSGIGFFIRTREKTSTRV